MKINSIVVFLVCTLTTALAAAEFKVELTSRTPAANDEDQNRFELSINDSAEMGPREMDAFRQCVVELTTVREGLGEQSFEAELLKLTETRSLKLLKSQLDQLTCDVWKKRRDDPDAENPYSVTLTTPTDVGLTDMVENHLQECLASKLDDSRSRRVTPRRQLTPGEIELRNNERYCGDPNVD